MKIVIDENVSYYHFTNPVRFPAEETKGIIYIRHGNLTSEDETKMVENCFHSHELEVFQGKLVTLHKGGMRFR